MARSVEIICIGTELLIGKTLNTNAHWLAKRITSLGSKVARITVVEDDVDEIASSVKEAMRRKTHFIITVGGLGPTFDDKTLEGLAKALECKLEINNEALNMVEEKYRKYMEEGRMEKVELTPPRVKMARLPQGAKPLFNPVGTAPGVVMEHEGATIVALPGVPSEMKAIFEEAVLPLLKEAAGDVTFFETSIEATGVMESEIAPLIDEAMHDNPYVYVKSHPKGSERVPRIEFHLSTTAEDSSVARNRVSKALVQLSELIQGKGGKIKPVKTEDDIVEKPK
ncbi:MAG: competence damage-inducible protein A [Candidatus Bathyarchaeota archaeon BA2]|nr:MAG: competence damage-inducible protein A [Candidatus Bathyarchaeota archaeon BA2]